MRATISCGTMSRLTRRSAGSRFAVRLALGIRWAAVGGRCWIGGIHQQAVTCLNWPVPTTSLLKISPSPVPIAVSSPGMSTVIGFRLSAMRFMITMRLESTPTDLRLVIGPSSPTPYTDTPLSMAESIPTVLAAKFEITSRLITRPESEPLDRVVRWR